MSIDDIIPGEEEEKNVNPHRPIALSIAQSIQQAPGRPGRGHTSVAHSQHARAAARFLSWSPNKEQKGNCHIHIYVYIYI